MGFKPNCAKTQHKKVFFFHHYADIIISSFLIHLCGDIVSIIKCENYFLTYLLIYLRK